MQNQTQGGAPRGSEIMSAFEVDDDEFTEHHGSTGQMNIQQQIQYR